MSTENNQPETDDLAILRDILLCATLKHVPFDGWTRDALLSGARDAKLTQSDAMRAFPDGARDMIPWHSGMADKAMLRALHDINLMDMRIRDRIATAVRVRLDQNLEHREAVRRALSFLAMPQNTGIGARSLYRTVDDMWFAAGDTATDWNFYSKRALLAGVYSSTLLVWLDDRSEDCADTWAFLDRRIENVMQIPKISSRLRGTAKTLRSYFPFALRRSSPFRSRA